jgi:predicted SAM-dependent methyltransferase
MEHVHVFEAIGILKECYTVLSPSGYLRLTLPDFNFAIGMMRKRESFSRWPMSFRSPSGQVVNFIFCEGQHKYAYTEEMLEEIGEDIGFSRVESAIDRDPNIPENMDEPVGSLSVNLHK